MAFLNDPLLWLNDILIELGLSYKLASFISTTGMILVILALSWLANLVARVIIRQVLIRIVKRKVTAWNDIFLEKKVLTRLSHFVPAIIIWSAASWILRDYPVWLTIVQRLAITYMLVVAAIVINSFIESWYKVYLTLPISKNRPIKGYVQIVKIIVVVFFSLLIYSALFRKEVSAIIAGLGVMASVLMLIFKDAILGLVASIQLSANKMLKIGDWISIPERNVDGEVLDITLTTVKIRNFDKTIITVPTYSLVNESFQNWVGMQESGVRHRPPNEDGIPLQVYAFTNRIDLVTYENVQSEIFEHLLSFMNEFGLRVFQLPSEYDYIRKQDK